MFSAAICADSNGPARVLPGVVERKLSFVAVVYTAVINIFFLQSATTSAATNGLVLPKDELNEPDTAGQRQVLPAETETTNATPAAKPAATEIAQTEQQLPAAAVTDATVADSNQAKSAECCNVRRMPETAVARAPVRNDDAVSKNVTQDVTQDKGHQRYSGFEQKERR